jgi:hypothetical protein
LNRSLSFEIWHEYGMRLFREVFGGAEIAIRVVHSPRTI